MLVLYETPAGYALFKLLDDAKVKNTDNIFKCFETPELANSTLKLKAFSKFENTTDALSAVTSLVEGKIPSDLKDFLKRELVEKKSSEKLAISDSKLAGNISKKLGLQVISDSVTMELTRGIRNQISSLITGLPDSELSQMALGLSHTYSRYKLKFSPDKVDTMIVQAIALLDDLDKELNVYTMRLKEWYGWHFPELPKIVVDSVAFAKCVKAIGMRENISSVDLSSILPEELEKEVKTAAEMSTGTEISEDDIFNITHLANQVVSISQYRTDLFEYLKNRMLAIAPNLTCLVGELVGARLIAHAGSLLNLAKQPASTVQIFGAEKALFRALKTKHDTPKYGLIYHASLIGQAAPKLKGKISRILAAKASLAIRVDALCEKDSPEIGAMNRLKVEERLRTLEAQAKGQIYGSAKGKPQQKKFEFTKSKSYNASDDFVSAPKKLVEEVSIEPQDNAEEAKESKKEKKEKKKDEKKTEKEEKKSKKRNLELDSESKKKSKK